MNAVTLDSIRPDAKTTFSALMAVLGAKIVRAFELAGKPYTVEGVYYM